VLIEESPAFDGMVKHQCQRWDQLRNDIPSAGCGGLVALSAQFLERGPENHPRVAAIEGAVTGTHIEVHNAVVDGGQAVLELRIPRDGTWRSNDPDQHRPGRRRAPVTLSTCHVYKIPGWQNLATRDLR